MKKTVERSWIGAVGSNEQVHAESVKEGQVSATRTEMVKEMINIGERRKQNNKTSRFLVL